MRLAKAVVFAGILPLSSCQTIDFLATTASGSITANNGIPLRLQMDVTTRSASGETIHLGGEAIFSYGEVRDNCS